MAHVTRKHGNRGEHGNVASMAIQSHGGSGNRAGKTKVLGGSLLEGDVCCTMYSLSVSEEEKEGFLGGGCICTLWHQGQERIQRSGNQRLACSTITL